MKKMEKKQGFFQFHVLQLMYFNIKMMKYLILEPFTISHKKWVYHFIYIRVNFQKLRKFIDEFLKDNEVRVSTEAFGEDDVEYTDWYINSRGELEIGDTDHWDDNDDIVWLMEDGLLIAYDRDGRTKVDDDARVYMVKID